MSRFALHSTRVIHSGRCEEATVVVNGDKIESVEKGNLGMGDMPREELGNTVLMPGLIDSHVHINEPGRTDWEGFNTATRAAAAGGITTLIDMPLNSSPVTTTVEALRVKIDAARKNLHVNCGFYGGIIPGNKNNIPGLLDAGVFGIKAFLTHSGIDEFPNVSERDLRDALPVLKKYDAILLVHAELDSPHRDQSFLVANSTSYDAFLRSRPKDWEDTAIRLMIDLCKEFDVRVHIVHLSSSNSIRALMEARDKGVRISTETCPHYLVFRAEDIADGATLFKCAPPIRESENKDELWRALKSGLISFIVTDHSPAPPEMKELKSGDFMKAWGGISGLQFSLPAIWSKTKDLGFALQDISELMSGNVAKFLGLETKGRIAKGYDADLIAWYPEKEFTVSREMIEHRHKDTPYEGMTLSGVVEKTFVGGQKVYEGGKFLSLNQGKILIREYNG